MQDAPHDWDRKLVSALWAYRTAYKVTTNQTPFRLAYGQEAVVPLEFMVPSLRIAVDHDLDYNAILRARLEKLLTLDEQRQRRAVWCQQIVQNRRKTWHDKHIKPREYKKGDLVLLYQSRMGPKKPNLTIAWASPYQIDWVYTNGSVKLVDLQGLALPGYYNASKIKHYEYVHDQVSTPDKVATDDEIHLNHTMFDEPTVGSVELLHEYDQLWAEVLDETNQSLSGESMITAQPGWDSEQEERDSFVKTTSHEETMQAKYFCRILQVQGWVMSYQVLSLTIMCQVTWTDVRQGMWSQVSKERRGITCQQMACSKGKSLARAVIILPG